MHQNLESFHLFVLFPGVVLNNGSAEEPVL